MATPTLKEMQEETLVQKHLRLEREKCRHKDIYSSSVTGPDGVTYTNSFCWDCTMTWNSRTQKAGQ